jgi:hypothetical protein
MLEDRISKLQVYSIGIVVNDKPRNSDMIDVYPVEEMPFLDGLIKDQKKNYNVTLPDHKNVSRKSKMEGRHFIKAQWFPYGHSNRISAPDVVRNETVIIYRYADTEDYYWTTIFREPKIRRLETVTYMYGNLTAPLVSWDRKSSYWMEVSTHDKHVRLHTSKSDGEPFAYDIYLNTKAGTLEIKDDVGNGIKLSSRTGRASIQSNSDIILKAPNIYLDGFVKISDRLDVEKAINVNATVFAFSHAIPGAATATPPPII